MREGLRSALEPLLVQQQLRAALELPGDSYWHLRPQRNFPPATIRDPGHHGGGERLARHVAGFECLRAGAGAA